MSSNGFGIGEKPNVQGPQSLSDLNTPKVSQEKQQGFNYLTQAAAEKPVITLESLKRSVHFFGKNIDAKNQIKDLLKQIGEEINNSSTSTESSKSDTSTALETLKKLAEQGTRYRSLIASTIGSSIQEAGTESKQNDESSKKIAAGALKTLVFLSKGQKQVLKPSDRQHVFAKLGNLSRKEKHNANFIAEVIGSAVSSNSITTTTEPKKEEYLWELKDIMLRDKLSKGMGYSSARRRANFAKAMMDFKPTGEDTNNQTVNSKALDYLKQCTGDPKAKSLMIEMLISAAKGGDDQIRAVAHCQSDDKGKILVQAFAMFAALSKEGTLNADDKQLFYNSLRNEMQKAAIDADAPIWDGIRSLPLEQRSELADIVLDSQLYKDKQAKIKELEGEIDRAVLNKGEQHGVLGELNDALLTFGQQLDLRIIGFENLPDPESLNIENELKSSAQQVPESVSQIKTQVPTGKLQELCAQAKQIINEAKTNTNTQLLLEEHKKKSCEIKGLKEELSSLRASIISAQCGLTTSEALANMIKSDSAFEENKIYTYDDWVKICKNEKNAKKEALIENISSATQKEDPQERIQSLTNCITEAVQYCKYADVMEILEKKIQNFREAIGMKRIPFDELFAPSGNDALQFGNTCITNVLKEIIPCLFKDKQIPQALREQSTEHIYQTPAGQAKLLTSLISIIENPTIENPTIENSKEYSNFFNYDLFREMKDQVLNAIEIATKAEKNN